MILEMPTKKGPEKIIYKRLYPAVIKRKEMNYEKDEFNSHQNFLYKRAIFGLSMFTPKQLNNMRLGKKLRIEKISKNTQEILNLWKQEITILISNRILESIFPNSEISKFFIKKFSTPDPKFINKLDFKSLNVGKKLIVDKLIKEGILPSNFYEIKEKERSNKPKLNRSRHSISVL